MSSPALPAYTPLQPGTTGSEDILGGARRDRTNLPAAPPGDIFFSAPLSGFLAGTSSAAPSAPLRSASPCCRRESTTWDKVNFHAQKQSAPQLLQSQFALSVKCNFPKMTFIWPPGGSYCQSQLSRICATPLRAPCRGSAKDPWWEILPRIFSAPPADPYNGPSNNP